MVNLMIQIWYHRCCYILSKVHRRSLNLLWCVIPIPKLAKCTNRSSNLLIVSYESQIYLNNLLNLFRSRRSTQAAADLTEAMTVVTGTEPETVHDAEESGHSLRRRGTKELGCPCGNTRDLRAAVAVVGTRQWRRARPRRSMGPTT
jgi:hypothetical protein